MPYIIVIEYREIHSNNNTTEQSCIENWKYYSQPEGNLTQVSVPPNLGDYDTDSFAGDINSSPFGDFSERSSADSSSSSDSEGFPPDFGAGFGELFGLESDDPCNFFNILTDTITQGWSFQTFRNTIVKAFSEERSKMENAGWTLKKCKEYEKEQIDKCFPETEMPGNDAAFDHSECRNPEELSKKIVRLTNIDRMARLRPNS